MKAYYFRAGSALALAASLGLSQAKAQTAPTPEPTEVSEVVVTGSFIAGTPEDAALPVDVIGAEELAKQGSPSTVEMIKALTASSGVLGESNQFTSGRGQGAEGTGSINLRGLGPERTLVLLNGKRLPFYATIVDTNMIPQSAIGRIEILKDGAAATYGSDAIGGVVNFITKKNFNGLEVGATYRFVDGSDGDLDLNASWGWVGERGDVFLSGGYQHRSQLLIRDRGFALQPYLDNPEGGWTGASNPGNFIPVTGSSAVNNSIVPVGAQRADPGCAALGGILTNPSASVPGGFSSCRTNFTQWDNLVDEQKRYQIYGEINFDLSESMKFHVEALYGSTDVPHASTTPSYATSRPITRTVLPNGIPNGGATGFNTAADPDTLNFFYVPASNPGFAAFATANPTYFTGPAPVTGAFITIGQFRPFLAGGNPLFGYKESVQVRRGRELRIVGDLAGDFGEVGPLGKVTWDVSFDYGRYERYLGGYDALTGRLELALRGLGGPGCNFQTGTPGVGACQYFNPFSNAVPANGVSGAANPGFNGAVQNTAELAAWLFPFQDSKTVQQLAVWEGVLSGETPIELPGGKVAWAAGAQYKKEYFTSKYNGLASADINPCSDSPITGANSCFPSPTSPAVFLGVARDLDVQRDNWAGFAELRVPITDTLDVQLAARYEDYRDQGGDTFNPQIRAKWQATDILAFRGSLGTTFRAPPTTFLIPDPATSLQNVLGAFRPVDVSGNPDLKPEKATTYSVGTILDVGNFRATIDYWRFDFRGIITSEPLTPVVNALFPTGSGTGNCATLDPAFIASHFEFSGPCSAANVTKVKTLRINGPDVTTSGVDILADYSFDDVFGGQLSLGGSASWVATYKVEALKIGDVQAAAAYDAVGRFNVGQIAYPLPEWKAQLFAEFKRGPHNLRWTLRYIDRYVDDRAALFAYNAAYQTTPAVGCGGVTTNTTPGCGFALAGQTIKAQMLNDVSYRLFGPWDTTVTATVTNVFDKDPPFARTELNYDPLTGDPLGRAFKVGVQKKF
jgi:iron complex outermembrane receptor protein